MSKRFLALFALLALLAVGVAACGSSGDEGAAPKAETAGGTGEMTAEGETRHQAPSPDTAAADLRVTLDRLLGEHAVLAIAATQKGLRGEPDFKAVAGILDKNSVELANAIGSVYGDEARKEFLDGNSKWRDHIGFFVDYTVALANKDRAAQRKAVGDLRGYIESSSSFLAQATGLPQPALRQAVTQHVLQLKGQIDAYARGDYAKSARLTRTAYKHMFMTGDTLAGAIVEQSPEKFDR